MIKITKRRHNRYVIFHPLTGKFYRKIDYRMSSIKRRNNTNQFPQVYYSIFVDDINDAQLITTNNRDVALHLYKTYIILDKEDQNIVYSEPDLEIRQVEIIYKMLP